MSAPHEASLDEARRTGVLAFIRRLPGLVKAATAVIVAIAGLGTALTQLGLIGGGGTRSGLPSISMYPSSSSWDSITYGSHWHAVVAWQTSGQVSSCTLRDNQGNGPIPVDANSPKYFIGSYPHTVHVVVATVECKGPGGTRNGSINVQVPAAPPVQFKLLRVQSAWIDPNAKTHWQIFLTWRSNGVDCSIWDDVQKHWFHKDPRGETAGPYGDFATTVKRVDLRVKCLDVAFAPVVTSFSASQPGATAGSAA